MLAITLGVFVLELVGGLASNSLALIADAGHVFTDVVGVGLALGAIWIASRPPTDERTFGYYRAEILGAVINALLLFGVAAYVLYEAWKRLTDPPEVATGLMLAIALAGGAANLVSLLMLRRAQAESLNMRGAYLEVLGDLL
ncbi:MAG: cation diffusion facilitator family transporter, partial [Dehalococcoidia bacterium]